MVRLGVGRWVAVELGIACSWSMDTEKETKQVRDTSFLAVTEGEAIAHTSGSGDRSNSYVLDIHRVDDWANLGSTYA